MKNFFVSILAIFIDFLHFFDISVIPIRHPSSQSSSLSNNTKSQILQKCFQDVYLFSLNLIECLNIYADSQTTNFIKTALIFDKEYAEYVNDECLKSTGI